MNKRFAFLITLLIVFPLVLAACGGDDDDGGDLSSESFTNAFNALLEGDPEPAKALACEDVHGEIEEAAAAMGSLTDTEGSSVSADCDIDGDTATCAMTVTVEIEGQDPIETTEDVVWEVEDGKICQQVEAE